MEIIPLSCVVLDDEPLAVELLTAYVLKTPRLILKQSFTDSLQALDYLSHHPVDLLFLDVQMPELNGIQLMKILKGKPKVILTTAYSEFAVDGFEYNAVDYLMKPVSFERFLVAVSKVNRDLPSSVSSVMEHHSSGNGPEYLFIKSGYKVHKVLYSEIDFLEGLRDYVAVHVDGKKLLTQQSMKSFEEVLPHDRFVRIHKSYIIALSKIEFTERNRVKVAGELLPVSDTYKTDFHSRISEK